MAPTDFRKGLWPEDTQLRLRNRSPEDRFEAYRSFHYHLRIYLLKKLDAIDKGGSLAPASGTGRVHSNGNP